MFALKLYLIIILCTTLSFLLAYTRIVCIVKSQKKVLPDTSLRDKIRVLFILLCPLIHVIYCIAFIIVFFADGEELFRLVRETVVLYDGEDE